MKFYSLVLLKIKDTTYLANKTCREKKSVRISWAGIGSVICVRCRTRVKTCLFNSHEQGWKTSFTSGCNLKGCIFFHKNEISCMCNTGTCQCGDVFLETFSWKGRWWQLKRATWLICCLKNFAGTVGSQALSLCMLSRNLQRFRIASSLVISYVSQHVWEMEALFLKMWNIV